MSNKSKIMRFKTDFLFTIPSILSAIGSFFSFSGFYYEYNHSKDGTEADNRALAADWNMIGQDLNDAIVYFESDIELENEGKKEISEKRQLDLHLN